MRNLIPQKRKDRHILEFAETRIPGTYQLSDPERIIAKFVVLPSVSESILEKASEDKILAAANALADDVIRIDGTEGKGWASYLTMDSRRKFGRETWANSPRHRTCIGFSGNHPAKKIWENCTVNLEHENFRLLWAGEWPLVANHWTCPSFD